MTSESPLFLTKVECPICKTLNEFETIKVGAYTESESDTDFCPMNRTWRNPRYQQYNPLLFFTTTCSNCFYTREFNNRFKEWKDDAYFKTYRLKPIKERHLEQLARADSIIKAISAEMDPNRYPNETAILKLLLAIFDEQLNDKPDDLDLGRFYLRIGWIFREMGQGGIDNIQVVHGHISILDEKYAELKISLNEFNLRINEITAAVDDQFRDESIPADIRSTLYPYKDRYGVEVASLKEVVSLIEGKLDGLSQIMREHRSIALGGSSENGTPGFHDYNSFHNYLAHLKEKWDGVPVSEKEALTWAVRYYVKAYKDGRNIAKGNQQIQAMYLIAELSRRIGEYEQAKEYFNITIRTGQEFIHKHRGDQSRTALARKLLELAIEQGRSNLAEASPR
nr:DUF2225 domain-containing protein [candidate division Zixibacteria bacterium]